MGFLNRILGKWTMNKAAPSTETIEERKSKIQAILGPLVIQKIIDSEKTASYIAEILVKMAEPELKQDAKKIIAGIMNKLANEARREFFLSVSMALLTAYGPDDAKKISEAIVEEHSRLVNTT